MPNAAAGAHPLNTAGLDDAFAAGGLLIVRLPGQNDGERRNSRMGMKAEFGSRRRIGVEVVEKDERLDPFTNVARTDQSGKAPCECPRVRRAICREISSARFGRVNTASVFIFILLRFDHLLASKLSP
jgi:hypothetical protein